MKKIDSGLACIELGSVAIGYRVLNAVSGVPGVRVLEASPCGPKFLILLAGEKTCLENSLREGRRLVEGTEAESWIDSDIFETKSQSVLEALFALTQESIDESLVVIECASVCGCLSAAYAVVDGHGLKPIEIRLQRSSTGAAYGFFTGRADQCGPAAEDARARLRAAVREGRVEVVDHPSKTFRSFFESTGTD